MTDTRHWTFGFREGESRMGRPSKYSIEFRRDAVTLVRTSGEPLKKIARDLDVHPETLRGWVRKDKVDRGEGAPGELTSEQMAELRELRKRVTVLEQERQILVKAAAFFAKETTR